MLHDVMWSTRSPAWWWFFRFHFVYTKVMTALILKHHCENAESTVYRNIASSPSHIIAASGCTGTGASFALCLACSLKFEFELSNVGSTVLVPLPAFLCQFRGGSHGCRLADVDGVRFESCLIAVMKNLDDLLQQEPHQVSRLIPNPCSNFCCFELVMLPLSSRPGRMRCKLIRAHESKPVMVFQLTSKYSTFILIRFEISMWIINQKLSIINHKS